MGALTALHCRYDTDKHDDDGDNDGDGDGDDDVRLHTYIPFLPLSE